MEVLNRVVDGEEELVVLFTKEDVGRRKRQDERKVQREILAEVRLEGGRGVGRSHGDAAAVRPQGLWRVIPDYVNALGAQEFKVLLVRGLQGHDGNRAADVLGRAHQRDMAGVHAVGQGHEGHWAASLIKGAADHTDALNLADDGGVSQL